MSGGKQFSANVSAILKGVGLLLVLVSLFDFCFQMAFSGLPPQASSLDNLRWQVTLVIEAVNRGSLLLVSLIVFLLGFWVDQVSNLVQPRRKLWRSLGVLIFVISGLIGLSFLLVVPLHFNNTRLVRQEMLEQIDQRATQAETELRNTLDAEISRQRSQIGGILQNPDQLDQAIKSGQVSNQEATLLKQFQQNPQSLEQFLTSQARQIEAQRQSEIKNTQTNAEQQVRAEAVRTGFRGGLLCLMLAIGFTVVSWVGVRELSQADRQSILE